MSPKFPRTHHLPFSPGGTSDDKRLKTVDHLLGVDIVITEKLDGSNVCLERNAVYARSHSGPPDHPSFDALKALHAGLRFSIPEGYQIFGEWLYAKHSISYDRLPNYLVLFAGRDLTSPSTPEWCSWLEVEMLADDLGVAFAPVLAQGRCGSAADLEEEINSLVSQPSKFSASGPREGVVVRHAAGFPNGAFATSVAKWVRANHVQTDDHWKNQAIVRNGLAG